MPTDIFVGGVTKNFFSVPLICTIEMLLLLNMSITLKAKVQIKDTMINSTLRGFKLDLLPILPEMHAQVAKCHFSKYKSF